MKCIYCGCTDSKVVDSRLTAENNSIRRRRECINCGKRWTTYESVEQNPVLVIKKNGSIQPFDKNKIVNGLIKSCEKRPVSLIEIEDIASSVEKQLKDNIKQEIESATIGKLVLEKLKKVDDISFVRYSSVYYDFLNINELVSFLNKQ